MIGRNVWIGGGAIILPGVTIADDAIIGAGSVVTRDVPRGATALGNPARVGDRGEVTLTAPLNSRRRAFKFPDDAVPIAEA